MITYTHPAAGNLPIKTLVVKQWLTNIYIIRNYMLVLACCAIFTSTLQTCLSCLAVWDALLAHLWFSALLIAPPFFVLSSMGIFNSESVSELSTKYCSMSWAHIDGWVEIKPRLHVWQMSWLLKRESPGYGLWSLLKRLRFQDRQSKSHSEGAMREFQTKVKGNQQRQRGIDRWDYINSMPFHCHDPNILLTNTDCPTYSAWQSGTIFSEFNYWYAMSYTFYTKN